MTFVQRTTVILIFFAMITFGYWMASKNQSINQVRVPASIPRQKVFDFSRLESTDLDRAARHAMMNGLHAVMKNNNYGVSIGHFIMKDDRGQSLQACEYFGKLEITFEAQGIAVNGERPSLKVEGPCLGSESLARTQPLWIPVGEIRNQKPGDIEVNFQGQKEVTITTKNIPHAAWPSHWVLSQLKLVHSEGTHREISVSRKDVYELSRVPLILSWPDAD